MAVKLTSGFWKNKCELVRREVIPYQWEALNDRVEGASPSYCMRNYKTAGALLRGDILQTIKPEPVFEVLPKDKNALEDTFYGFAFQDSDFSKWIEAVAYSLTQQPDSDLEKTADEAIDIVCAAQRSDGYLDTYFLLRNPEGIFTNLRDYHELYCFGHLAEGAAAYYKATGKDKLLRCAQRFAHFISEKIGAEEGKLHGYPGHEEAELGLMRLYEATGCEEYLHLAKYFIDQRGKRPYYFDIEHPENTYDDGERYHYQQAHREVREQDEATGHAVRAVYLYAAMADAAYYTKDESLQIACERLWDSIENRKIYITGSIGGTHIGEAFSHDYDLPADTAYAETCAAIGLVFFAGRMIRNKPHSRYGEIMERALYNGILSGIALDGKSFFYVNPLECRPEDCRRDERKHHVKPVRQKWFGCACCPPNITRMLSSVGDYAIMNIDGTDYINMLISAENEHVEISSFMPHAAKGIIKAKTDISIALRIPQWAGEYKIGAPINKIENGYAYFTLSAGDIIDYEFSMPVRIVRANPQVREAAGQAAIMRGPLVYCLEGADNGNQLHLLTLCKSDAFSEIETSICGEAITALEACGKREIFKSSSLYFTAEPEYEDITLRFVPYYTWANRGENEMSVWVRLL